jgi:hypothetical protein
LIKTNLALENVHAPSRSHERGSRSLSTTFHGANVEKNDDFIDWYAAFARLPHSLDLTRFWGVREEMLAEQRADAHDDDIVGVALCA